MKFQPGQSGNPAGRTSEKLFTDAIRKAAFLEDPVKKKRRLDLIAEKLVQKAMAGDNWCIGQVGDRLDGKPKERQEHEGVVDHAIRIIWPGMPPIGKGSDSQISAEGSVPALPSPDPKVGDNRSPSPRWEDGGYDQ
jgi:hypothetical protein